MFELDDEVCTKEDFQKMFKKLGIQKGSIVLLQMDLSRYPGVVGSYQMVIETLKECIGDEGCLIMPTFSYSCLDPSCLQFQKYAYKDWKKVRENLPGYHAKKTMSDIYEECTNLFLQDKEVMRSNHPVYSFAYWGSFDEKNLKIDVNEPISFFHSLREMKNEKACNCLIGVPLQKSILLQAMANEYQLGQIIIQRAFIHSKRKVTKSFYITKADDALCQDLLDGCKLQKTPLFDDFIYVLSK